MPCKNKSVAHCWIQLFFIIATTVVSAWNHGSFVHNLPIPSNDNAHLANLESVNSQRIRSPAVVTDTMSVYPPNHFFHDHNFLLAESTGANDIEIERMPSCGKNLILESSPSSLLALEPPATQSQSQQMYNAMTLRTLQGTKWRLVLPTSPLPSSKSRQPFDFDTSSTTTTLFQDPSCTRYTLVFQGFANQPDKGQVQCTCERKVVPLEDAPAAAEAQVPITTSSKSRSSNSNLVLGRWLSKPSEIRKGTVQLSARWKVKNPSITTDVITTTTTTTANQDGIALSTPPVSPTPSSYSSLIFKGFIKADPTLAKGGNRIAAEMKGTVMESVGDKETTWGSFQADLIRTELTPDEDFRIQ